MTSRRTVDEQALDPIARLVFVIAQAVGMVFTAPAGSGFAIGELFRQQGLLEHRPTIMDFATMIEGHRRGEISDGEFTNMLQRSGFTDRAIGVFEELQRALISVGDLTELWRRDEISEGELTERLKEHGIEDRDAELIKILTFQVPGPQDVIRFTVREVFNPELRGALGLDAEFPVASEEAFKAAGLKEETAADFWAAHWELPSIQLGFEMLHRKEITEAELDLLLRANDVLPLFRQPIKNVAFRPLTRVDLRRMHALGLLDESELQSRYEDLGFAPENAALMVQFTVAFNDRPEDEVGTELRDLTRSQITRFLEQGLYDAERATAELIEIGFGPDDAATIVALSEIKVMERQRDAEVNVVRRRFANQSITFDEALLALDAIDLAATERDLIETQLEAERQSQVRTPTRAELTKFAKEQIISMTEYRDNLILIGYAPIWADRFVELLALGAEEDEDADTEG